MNRLFSSLFGRFQKLPPLRRTLLTIVLLFSVLLLLSWINRPAPSRHLEYTANSSPSGNSPTPAGSPNDQDLKRQWEAIKTMPKQSLALPQAPGGVADWAGKATEGPAPYIAQAAEVAVATSEFKKSRVSLEGILERHHAYAAKLRMVGEPSGSTLLATLRVPSSEFSATVEDLKGLGTVEREEQTADEITAQRADVEARLRNAQDALARLKGMLQQGWKAGNPAEIQRQLSTVGSEIARLEAERTATDHRVLFSQVLFALREQIVPPTESFSGQLHGAALAGLSDGLTTLSGILFFLVSRGPATLLWVLVVYFPAKWLWRKWRSVQTGNEQLQHGV